MATSEYTVVRDDHGWLRHIRRESDGQQLTKSNWEEFLNWNARQERPFDAQDRVFPESHKAFGTTSGLIDYCTKNGIILFAVMEHDGKAKFVPAELHDFGKGTIYRLQEAYAAAQRLGSPRRDAGPRAGDQDGMTGVYSLLWVTQDVWFDLRDKLKLEDSDVRRMSTWPTNRAFVYVDISDFSKQQPGEQVLIINALVRLVKHQPFWGIGFPTSALQALEAMLCIGDGYIFVFKDPEQATYFSAYLAQLIEESVARRLTPVAFHFRTGVHYGPVYTFWDWGRGQTGDWNFIGAGINGGQRVISAIKDADDVVFISAEVREELTARQRGTGPARQILAFLQNKGRRLDKHGNPWRVYEVNHTGIAATPVTAALSKTYAT